MKIDKIKINNYRLLKDFSTSLEENLSLVIGKNNTGKTSLLHILQKFLCTASNVFNFEDFSIEFQKEILETIANKLDEKKYTVLKLDMKLFIERNEEDSLENISDLILDLDPNNKTIILCFEYELNFSNYKKLIDDFENHHIENVHEFLKKHHKAYFNLKRKVVDIKDENNFIEVEDSKIQKIINVQTISAKRDVLNEDGDNTKNNKTLSKLSCKYFKPFENSQMSDVIDLQNELIKADSKLTKSYASIFKKITKDVEKFSYNGSKIAIKSNFQEVSFLKENASVVYDENGFDLPEDYTGLGYMNLFAIIFELHIIFDAFKRIHEKLNPSDINLLFIEEPEAHTHPQMQYVFIQNIKNFLIDNKNTLNLQTIITTHSAHITSQSNFNDIKYFLSKNGQVEVKNLSDLKPTYESDEKEKMNFKFLKQYLTLNSSELFFSDKIIFIEGDTERLLLPAMMRKLDIERKNNKDYIPLLSQKVSIIEVGANSKVFDEFLKFLEIKTLIITDIDSVKKNEKNKMVACKTLEATDTSNSSIKHYLPNKRWDELRDIQEDCRIIQLGSTSLCVAYQTKENEYLARSFEDAFFSLNFEFIKDNKENFGSLKNKEKLEDGNIDYFNMPDLIKKKTGFATDILFYTNEKFDNWRTPSYINKGLIWLAKN